MPTLRTVTLGCKVNQYETQYLREGLLRLGYRDAGDGQPADLCLVNTCTVTAEGDLKSRKAIRQLARQNPGAGIIVMGCYASRAADEVASLPGVIEVVRDKRQLPDLLQRLGLVDVPQGVSSFGPRHRAYVKVQDGCRQRCAYCVIPAVRPHVSSRPVDEVADEVAGLIGAGYREIVLTGIHLGHYRPGPQPQAAGGPSADLARLLERLIRLDGSFRLRLSSLEAAEVTPRLLDLMAENPERICPHLHIPIQSGSSRVLARMRRRADVSQLVDRCLAIRDTLDQPALTTDAIVGFPGETEQDFEATCRVVQQVEFSKIHVFRFSPRTGTPAADMPDQVPGNVKRERAAALAQLGNQLRQHYAKQLLGRRLQVLIESPVPHRPEVLVGTAGRYLPVEVTDGGPWTGQLVRVWADQSAGERICGVRPELRRSGPA